MSSPWPDRIDILDIERLPGSVYRIEAEVVEITSQEMAQGGYAAKRPVTLVVAKVQDRWLITGLEMGGYE